MKKAKKSWKEKGNVERRINWNDEKLAIARSILDKGIGSKEEQAKLLQEEFIKFGYHREANLVSYQKMASIVRHAQRKDPNTLVMIELADEAKDKEEKNETDPKKDGKMLKRQREGNDIEENVDGLGQMNSKRLNI